jgi:hypothetical protein
MNFRKSVRAQVFCNARLDKLCILLATFGSVTCAPAQYPATPQVFKDGTAVAIEEYATLPVSARGPTNPVPPYTIYLARANFLRSEPASAPNSSNRFFVIDMNRNFYILDKNSKTFTVYINFQRVFPKFDNQSGYGDGLSTFAFDPDYAHNGRLYTAHMENSTLAGSATPTNGALPGLDLTGYTTTTPINPPGGTITRQSVLIEWTDTNIVNNTFEGTAREVARFGLNDDSHPLGDLLFNPLARPGDSDYGNLYLSIGDSVNGETPGSLHTIPQRLDTHQGKILRITLDITLRPADLLSDNGRYRIPSTGSDPNRFVFLSLNNVRKEIYAYGFRNPHRMSWDPAINQLIVNDIGLHSWEEVNFVISGGNYGWAEREGIEQVFVGGANNGKTGSQTSPATPFPTPDSLTVTGINGTVTPLYPVAEYSHRDGDAISSGFPYHGSLVPQLRGKYVFGDITTGRLLCCNMNELVAANDVNRTTVAPVHELQVAYNGDERRLFDVARDKYNARGGSQPGNTLPGISSVTDGNDPYGVPYGRGRVDMRLAMGGDGEIYVLSKSDGMVRKLVGGVSPPSFSSITMTNGIATLSWCAISNRQYRVQFRTDLVQGGWSDLAGDVTATSQTASKNDSIGGMGRYYRLILLP